MADTLSISLAFELYVKNAANYIRASAASPTAERWHKLAPAQADELRSQVRKAEMDPAFDALLSATTDGKDALITRWEIETFFRRSDAYLSLYRGESLKVADLSSAFIAHHCRTKPRTRTRYLAPLYAVGFAENIDLKVFQIRQFSSRELSEILDDPNSAVFYPEASVDVERLSDYWFIDTTVERENESSAGGLAEIDFDSLDVLAEVSKGFTSLPQPIERAAQLLVLWDWEGSLKDKPKHSQAQVKLDKGAHWPKFSIPTVITVSDDWLAYPSPVPEIPPLPTEPRFDEDGEEVGVSLLYDAEVWDVPDFTSCLSALNDCIERTIRRDEWSFVSLALGFLAKAFFSKDLDEFLWHIVVLEALLGDSSEAARSISTRLRTILGHESAGARLAELYKHRSNLVHGSVGFLSMSIYQGHLREARRMARLATIWFLHYVAATDKLVENGLGFVPDRKQLLSVIDVSGTSAENLRQLLDAVPQGFPNIQSWQGYFSF